MVEVEVALVGAGEAVVLQVAHHLADEPVDGDIIYPKDQETIKRTRMPAKVSEERGGRRGRRRRAVAVQEKRREGERTAEAQRLLSSIEEKRGRKGSAPTTNSK